MKLREVLQNLGRYSSIIFGSITTYEFIKNLKRDHVDIPRESAAMQQNAELKAVLKEQRDTIITDSILKGKIEAEGEVIRRSMDEASTIDSRVGELFTSAMNPDLSVEERTNLMLEIDKLKAVASSHLQTADASTKTILD
jgi:hypothetical protein